MAKEQSGTLRSFYMVKRPGLNDLHSVHMDGCPFLPAESKRIFLGRFMSLSDARNEGNKYHSNNCGCRFCNPGMQSNNKKTATDFNLSIMNFQTSGFMKYLN